MTRTNLTFDVDEELVNRKFQKEHNGLTVNDFKKAIDLGITPAQYSFNERLNALHKSGRILWVAEPMTASEFIKRYNKQNWFLKLLISLVKEPPKLRCNDCLTCSTNNMDDFEVVAAVIEHSFADTTYLLRCKKCGNLSMANID